MHLTWFYRKGQLIFKYFLNPYQTVFASTVYRSPVTVSSHLLRHTGKIRWFYIIGFYRTTCR